MTTEPIAAPKPAAPSTFDPTALLASELTLPPASVASALQLLGQGATVPFIARYRKEATGGLDEVQVRAIEERSAYLHELESRRTTIRTEIEKQGKMTDELRAKLQRCGSKTELEDLYLPFKPKRRTRAILARERGLEPLADRLWAQPADGNPAEEAAAFVAPAKEVPDVDAALAGARDICAERIAEDANLRKQLRDTFREHGAVHVTKEKEFREQTTKFDTYENFEEPLRTLPSHRYLAIRRGEAEGVLKFSLEVDPALMLPAVLRAARVRPSSPWAAHLEQAAHDAYKRLLLTGVQSDVRIEGKLAADRAAVEVFAQNLRQLLLSAPFGAHTVIGIDPGQRTGCKCVVIDGTGKLLHNTVLHLLQGDGALGRARAELTHLCRTYDPRAIAVGNGTHGRETESFVRETLEAEGMSSVVCIAVNESGASVYSASDIAREEFPDHDLTVRGAASIARRLQDPLAELVKIDPKSIGVGQYQHDVHQPLLTKKLSEVVESCVNSVGVEVNTASPSLLSYVAGIGASAAKNIVAYRNEHGPFRRRSDLLSVAGIGPRAFQQAAGFLRIRDAENPLDASAVHPERYPLVEKMAADLQMPIPTLIGNQDVLRRLDRSRYMSGDVGSFTLDDIVAELQKPGRDPRANFEAPQFRQDVRTMADLRIGMELEGVVTNVTAFGAFVDVGVHQDGLVHISRLADRFVKDPGEVVKVGDRRKVYVLEIDVPRKRIALSARASDAAAAVKEAGGQKTGNAPRSTPPRRPQDAGRGRAPQPAGRDTAAGFSNNPFEQLLRK